MAKRTDEELLAEIKAQQKKQAEKARQEQELLKEKERKVAKRIRDRQDKERTHRLCVLGGTVENIAGGPVEGDALAAVSQQLKDGIEISQKFQNIPLVRIIRWATLGRAIEGVLNKPIEGDALNNAVSFLRQQEERGQYWSHAVYSAARPRQFAPRSSGTKD